MQIGLSGKDWEIVCLFCFVLPAFFVLNPGRITTSNPLRTIYLFAMVLFVLWTQTPLAFRASFLGGYSSVGSLKSWSANYEVQTLCSSGRRWEFRDPLQLYGALPGVGFMAGVWLSLSYPFQCEWCGYFLIHLTCRSHSANWYCVFGVSVGGAEFKRITCHLLGPKLPLWLFLNSSFLFWLWSMKRQRSGKACM